MTFAAPPPYTPHTVHHNPQDPCTTHVEDTLLVLVLPCHGAVGDVQTGDAPSNTTRPGLLGQHHVGDICDDAPTPTASLVSG